MSDPIERLRKDASRMPGAEQDGLDLDGLLGRIHGNTDGKAPGGLTRQRRVQVGAWGVAGIGAVAAAGLVVSGVLTPDGGTSPEAAPHVPATTTPHAAASAATPQGGVTAETVVYVKKARSAVARLALKDMIVSSEETDGIKHPDDAKMDTTSTREVLAGDGSASRWTDVKELDGQVGTDMTGDQEVKKAIPGAEDGRMTYWYVSPRKGVYAEFPWSVGDGDPSVPDQIKDYVATVSRTLETVEEMAALKGVTSSPVTTTTIDGKEAVCLRMKGDGVTSVGWGATKGKGGSTAEQAVKSYQKALKAMGKNVRTDVVDWSSRTCFDPETQLPVLHTYSTHYQLAELKTPSYSTHTTRYAWLPRNASTEKLVAPDLEGLQQVSRDRYFQLTK
ncbi:hypothetical protein ACFT5B_00320 [Luteimicrobium sp. NPDC057192]|uniref:hypothetical protein n=1 Tax=Luteimicrobium sp. NPDC057192 TaxID=3346042 RepID=UPI00362D3C1F